MAAVLAQDAGSVCDPAGRGVPGIPAGLWAVQQLRRGEVEERKLDICFLIS